MPGVAERVELFLAQSAHIADWLAKLPADAFGRPSVLHGWDVRTLVGHVVLVQRGLVLGMDLSPADEAAAPAEYVARYEPAAGSIAERTLTVTADRDPAELIAELRGVEPVRAACADVADSTIVRGARGPIAAIDWAETRLLELAVHTDDLSRSLPDVEPVPLDRRLLGAVVRLLADILAIRAPGRSVELRVPPFAAVQVAEGPRHARGTPPNVVESDPLTWLRVATGRLSFADAVAEGHIRATGPRSDLSEHLPILS